MEELFKQTPAIIEQAAKSPLGLLALMVIILAGLGLVFFKDASEKTRVLIFVLLLAGAATFGYAAFSVTGAPPQQQPAARAGIDVAGQWLADVNYGWARHDERFSFDTRAGELFGTASFLQTPRGIQNAQLSGDKLSFETRSTSVMGSEERHSVHRYVGQVADDRIDFVMQTEGGFGTNPPVSFVARRNR